jgi:hypothetical protein
MEYCRDKQGVPRGITPDGYMVKLDPRPRIEHLLGRFAQNGIRIPRTGRWIVLTHGLIEKHHVAEIERRVTVLPTLYIGTRKDGPIVQAMEEQYG